VDLNLYLGADLVAAVTAFVLVLARTSSVVMTVPLLGAESVPTRVRLAVALPLTFVLVVAFPVDMTLLRTTERVLTSLLSEVVLGAVVGLCVKFVFLALEGAGSAAGLAMGMGFAQSVNALTGTESNPIGKLLTLVGTMFALQQGLIDDTIRFLAVSLHTTRIGEPLSVGALLSVCVTHALGAIALAVRIGFPVAGAVTLGHIALGLVGRGAPQLNLSSVGFSIAVMAGGVVLYTSVMPLCLVVAQAMREALNTF
jgi:flagellar biosynthetic protein FliR